MLLLLDLVQAQERLDRRRGDKLGVGCGSGEWLDVGGSGGPERVHKAWQGLLALLLGPLDLLLDAVAGLEGRDLHDAQLRQREKVACTPVREHELLFPGGLAQLPIEVRATHRREARRAVDHGSTNGTEEPLHRLALLGRHALGTELNAQQHRQRGDDGESPHGWVGEGQILEPQQT